MAKVYFFNGGSHGHINPTLGLVTALVKRGEEVFYYSTPEFKPLIEQTGAIFREYAVEAPQEEITGAAHMAAYHLRYGATLLPGLIEQAQLEKPDYILFDIFRVWGWQLGKILNVPTISSSPSFAFNEAIISKIAPDFSLGGAPDGVDYFAQYAETAAQIKQQFGVDSPSLLEALSLAGDLMLVFTTREFQPAAELLSDAVRFVGPSIESRPQTSDFPFERLRNRQVVFISLGTVFNNRPEFYRNCLAAFANTDVVVVMAVGEQVDRAALGDIPANFIVHNFVPQLEILKHADVFVTHGGLGSVHEALFFGVPMVLYPQMMEQSANAWQVIQHGAGVGLRGDQPMVSVEELRDAVMRVLTDPTFKLNARRVGGDFSNYSAAKTADIVQQFVKASKSVSV